MAPRDFNSYGSRRGNHEVMVRGTFANIRLRNRSAPARTLPEGGFTRYLLRGDAGDGRADVDLRRRDALQQRGRRRWSCSPGKEYGTGSSRDWAAKGTRLLGVRAVIAESFERIHRSNLIGMGVLPLQFPDGRERRVAGPDRRGVLLDQRPRRGDGRRAAPPPASVRVTRASASGSEPVEFDARVRIDTPREAEYFRHGGILQYVLRGCSPHESSRRTRSHAASGRAGAGVAAGCCSSCSPRAGPPATRPPRRGLARGRRRVRRRSAPTSIGTAAGARAAPQHGVRGAPRRLLVMGHIDEIGLIVTHIDDEGYLWFRAVGGWDAQILVGQRVMLDTADGTGARAWWARSRSTCCARRSARRSPSIRDLHIDIGARDGDAGARAACGSATSR